MDRKKLFFIEKGNKVTKEVTIDEVLELNQPILHKTARKYMVTGLEFDDLYQYAAIGLTKAYNNYDIEVGVTFSTYCFPMIFGEVKRYIRDINHRRRKGASDDDFTFISFDNVIYHDNGNPIYLKDRICDESIDIETDTLNNIFLESALEKLNDKEKRIIQLRYFNNLTQVQVGKMLNISQVQISRIEKKCMNKIREAMLCKEKEEVKSSIVTNKIKIEISKGENVMTDKKINRDALVKFLRDNGYNNRNIVNFAKLKGVSVGCVHTHIKALYDQGKLKGIVDHYGKSNINPKTGEGMEEAAVNKIMSILTPDIKPKEEISVNIEEEKKESDIKMSNETMNNKKEDNTFTLGRFKVSSVNLDGFLFGYELNPSAGLVNIDLKRSRVEAMNVDKIRELVAELSQIEMMLLSKDNIRDVI